MKKATIILVICLAFFANSAHASKYWARGAKSAAEQNTRLLNNVLAELREVKQALKEAEAKDCNNQ